MIRERPIPTNREPSSRTALARRLAISGWLGCSTLAALVPSLVSAQVPDSPAVCEAGRISNIFVDNR